MYCSFNNNTFVNLHLCFTFHFLDYRPRSHWSIDPFGLSPILTYAAKASNLTHAAVQRVHYSVKKFLAQKKNLEFKWRQLWAGKDDKTDIFTHMFPFYSYDVPHTCGPDPKVGHFVSRLFLC